MKLAIMQPYFFPYIGYFQMINAVDEFVVYDNIEYTKKGWINRNRILVDGKDAYISLPLRKDSDFLQVKDRCLAETWAVEKKKILNRVTESYRKAPQFAEVFPLIQTCLQYEDSNLFNFILHSIRQVNAFLGIPTQLVISSSVPIDHQLKSEEKVIAITKSRNASIYMNPIGGLELYSKDHFKESGIDLIFHKSRNITYPQFKNDFVPWLSIIDVMMFNSKDTVKNFLEAYDTLS